MPYTETLTKQGETSTVVISDLAALRLVWRGQRLNAPVTATKDGTLTVTRKRGTQVTATITLTPASTPVRLTKTQRQDLELIRLSSGRAVLRDGRIRAALRSIPPAAAARLLDKGLILADGEQVFISLAGRLAMAAYEHQAYTVGGYDEVSDGERFNTFTGERVRSYGYFVTALCSCGKFSSVHTERQTARWAARRHREDVSAAALGCMIPEGEIYR